MSNPEVLVVGAGPTGLVLALWLAKLGVRVRVIDKSPAPGLTSRAMAVHARTLEFYRQLGFADEVVRRGLRMDRIHFREGTREAAVFDFRDIGEGLSPYPFILSFPQDDHEKLLLEQFTAAGVSVDRNTELVGLHDDGERVRAVLRAGGVEETVTTQYLCGCDGAHSTVRHALGMGFPGGTYDQLFFVADAEATGVTANSDINACLGANTLLLVFPIRSTGMVRLIGLIPPELTARDDLTYEHLRPMVEKQTGVHVTRVNWFSKYHTHHRVADHFRVGRVFLSGDAAHIHSPAGGQGMNTGIGDAVNLAWKLAAVLQRRATPAVLDSYEPERVAFARTLVETTDRAFRFAVGSGVVSQALRTLVLPNLAPFALGFSAVRRAAFQLVSQVRIHYHDSPLSRGKVDHLSGGDRLPWVRYANTDNFAPLASVDWQAHVYGTATPELRESATRLGLPLHEFPWCDPAHDAGIEKDALYLVRPDGYLALVAADQDTTGLLAYTTEFGIRPRVGNG
jgi:2-polyprenyl-6-methoxyphenol hydroxylase-like FAD-dependent oxidoreductase